MKKILTIAFITILSCFISLFADDVIHPFTKLKLIQTEYFDIIYPEESTQTAFYLADIADEYYEKATELYKIEKYLHLPVVICPCTQDLNAHFSPVPYPHICLYDTMQVGSGDLYSRESMNEIFYHELIHAVTLTIASPEVRKAMKFMWPDFSLNLPTLNNSWFEGATVSTESMEGAGRLNNGFVWSYIVQAKIENKFPNFYEIACRNIYPVGQYQYYFGGAFAKYLQDTYGIDKYVNIWHQEENYSLKKIVETEFGKKYWEIWQDFEDSIPVPQLAPDDTVTECYGDMVKLVTSSTVNGKDFITFYSPKTSGIYKLEPGKKAKKIVTVGYDVLDFSVSKNGRFLLITDLQASNTDALRLRVYDLQKNYFTGKKLLHCKLGEVINCGENKYLVCVENNSTDSSINLYNFDTMELVWQQPLKHFSEITEICRTDNGFAFLLLNEGNFYFNYADISNGISNINISSFAFPQEIIPYYLNTDESAPTQKAFICSTAGHGYSSSNPDFPAALPRLTKIVINDNEANIQFQTIDISGGVFTPAVTSNGEYYFASSLAERKPLAKFTQKATIPGGFSKSYPMQQVELDSFEFMKKELNPNFEIAQYNPFKYMKKGLLFPYAFSPDNFAYCPTPSHMEEQSYLGLGYFSGLPSENFYFSLGGGYNPFNKNFGAIFDLLGGNKNLAYSFLSSVNFSKKGFSNITLEGDICGSLPLFNRYFELQYKANSLWQIYSAHLISNTNAGFMGLVFALQTGMGTYENLSFSSAASVYNSSLSGSNIGLLFKLHIPQILPFNNPWTFTLNWPATFTFHIIPDNATLMHGNCSIVVFGKEIQKQPGHSSLYFSRFTLTTGFDSSYYRRLNPMSILQLDGLMQNVDLCNQTQAVTGGIHLNWTPVIGIIASVQFDFGIDVKYYLLNQVTGKPYDISISGLYTF